MAKEFGRRGRPSTKKRTPKALQFDESNDEDEQPVAQKNTSFGQVFITLIDNYIR